MPLKIGIVGMRGIGETHAKAYQQDPLGKLVAVCDVVKERADAGPRSTASRRTTA